MNRENLTFIIGAQESGTDHIFLRERRSTAPRCPRRKTPAEKRGLSLFLGAVLGVPIGE
jgi:hypothetical protein